MKPQGTEDPAQGSRRGGQNSAPWPFEGAGRGLGVRMVMGRGLGRYD